MADAQQVINDLALRIAQLEVDNAVLRAELAEAQTPEQEDDDE